MKPKYSALSRTSLRLASILSLSAVTLIGSHSAQAAIFTWDGGAGNNNWSTAGNWTVAGVPTQPGTGLDDLQFGGGIRLAPNMEASYTINSLSFINTAGAFVLSNTGGTTLTIQGGGITNNDGTLQTINISNITLGAAQTWSAAAGALTVSSAVDNNGNLLTISAANASILSGAIIGGGGLTKNGTSTLTLSGAAANTYSGLTTVNAGTLTLSKTAGVTSIAGDLTIGDGSGTDTVTLTTANQIADTSAVTINAGGVLGLGTVSDTIGSLTMTAGSITSTSGVLTSTTDFDLQAGSASAILGGSVGVNKTTAGTVTLSGANTYTGATAISNGVLNIQNASALGTIAGATTVSNGAALQIQGGITTLAEGLTLDGTGIAADGALRNISGTNTYAGAITLGSATRINSDSGTLNLNVASGNAITATNIDVTFGGAGNVTVSDAIATGTGALTKDGAGTLTLSATNTYTGLTDVQAGTLALGASNVFDNASTLKVSGGILSLVANSDTVAGVQLTAGSITGTGTLTSTTDFDLQAGTVSGILGGSVGVNKTTAGTVTLSGANTYTGATAISNGVLNIQNASALGTIAGATTVSNGAALQIQGGITTLAEGLTLDGTGIAADGALRNISGTNTYAGAITLGSASRINSDAGTLTLNVASGNAITGTNVDVTFGGAGSVTVSDSIATGTGALTKDGAGTLTLSATNTYTGLTDVQVGTLALGAGNVFADTSTLKVSGGILSLAANSDTVAGLQLTSGSITGTTGVLTSTTAFDLQAGSVSAILGGSAGAIKTTGGTVTLSGINTYTGLTDVQAGTLILGANNIFADTSTLKVSGGILSQNTRTDTVAGVQLTAGSITGTTGVLTSTTAFDLQAGSVGAILGGAVGINKTTAGTVTLSGANTYTGATAISDGVLNIQNASALGTIAGATTVTSGAALQIQGGITTLAEALTLNGTGIAADGALRNISGDNIYAGAITLGSATRINSDSGTLTLNVTAGNAIAGTNQDVTFGGAGNVTVSDAIATGSGTLTKDGAGILTLSGVNTYTGLTDVQVGTLALGASNVFANTSTLKVSGGILSLVANSDTVAGVQLTSGSITGTTGVLTSTTAFDLQAGTISADLGGSAGAIKTTGGTVTLSGTNTYTGLTDVQAGTLILGANNIFADTSTLKVSGGILSQNTRTDTVAGVQLTAGSITGTSGVLTSTTAFDLQAGSVGAILGGAVAANKTTAGTVTLSAVNTYTGLTTVSAGTLEYGVSNALVGAVTISGGILDIKTFSDTVGAVTLSSGSITGTTGVLTGTSYAMQDGSVSAILGGGVALTKTTAGSVTLSGANTYTGATNISVGALRAANNTALGTVAGGVSITSGAALELDGSLGDLTIGAEALTLSGTGISNGGALRNIAGTNSYAGVITLGSASRINSDAGTLTLSGGITGAGNALTIGGAGNVSVGTTGIGGTNTTLTKDGAGTLNLNVANTFTGNTRIASGTLNLGTALALQSSTLDMNGADTGSLSFGILTTGTLGGLTGSRGLSLQNTTPAAVTLSVGNNNANTTYSGELSGSGALTKIGTGTLTLSGANSFAGVLAVQAGTLSIATINNAGTNGVLGNSANAVVLGGPSTAGTLQYTGGSATSDKSFGVDNGGGVVQVDTAATVLTLNGQINQLGSGLLTKTGAGTLTLGGADDNVGLGVIANAGTVVLDKTSSGSVHAIGGAGLTIGGATVKLGGTGGDQIFDGSIVTVNSGTLDFNGQSEGFDILNGSGGTILNNGGGASTLTITAGGGTYSGVIANNTSGGGTMALVKSGSGTQTLSGGSANTYNGLTSVNEGTLTLSKTAGDAIAGALTIGDGTGTDTVTLTANNQISNTSAVTINAGGVLGLNNTITDTIGTLTMTAGSVTTGTGTLTLGGNVTGIANAVSSTITGNLGLGATRTFTIGNGGGGNDMAISAIISGAFGVTKEGFGTLTLSGVNTYTGVTTVNQGTLRATTSAQALGTGAATLFLDGGSLELAHSSGLGFARNTTVNTDTGIITENTGGGAGITHTLGTLSIGTSTLTLNQVGAASGTQGLTFGAVTLTGAPTFTVNNDGGGATTLLTLGAINNGTNLLTFDGDGNSSVTGIIGGGSGGITKTGAGTLTLSGANTYTGLTTISEGLLLVNNSLGGTTISVSGGASLGGIGTIGTATAGVVTLADGSSDANRGSIDLTNGAIGTLSFAAKTAADTTVLTIGGTTGNASILSFDVGATVDKIALGTNARLDIGAGGGLVRLTGLGGLVAGTKDLITATATRTGTGTLTLDATTGNFSGFNVTTAFSGQNYQLTATANAAPTTAYWKGTNDGVWNSFFGGNSNISNFATDIGGANATGKVSSATDVIFNATTTGNFGSTTLGENLTIKTLTFGSNATSAVGIGGSNTLTITPGSSTTGVTVATGSGNHTISSLVALGANQTWTVTDAAQTLTASNTISGGFALTKAGAGALTLSGVTNSFSGSTTVNGGTLSLNYASSNTTKLANAAALILGGGTVHLTGGSHEEVVSATTINAGASAITRNVSGTTATLRLNAITRNAGGTLDIGTASIASTDTTNTGSTNILGPWATVSGSDWASNTDTTDGPILAYTGYTNVTRGTGTKIIADGTNTNVRITEGTGALANITLGGASTTTINTLNQSISGGTSAATIDAASKTLRVGGILVGTGAGGLTIGTAANSGTLTAKTSGGELILHNHSSNGLAINSTIANFTNPSSLTMSGTGTVTLNGTNTYTGITSVNAGTLIVNGDQSGATGAMSVASVAALMGTGTIGGATTILGTHSSGASAGAVGTQNFSSSLTYSSGSIFEWDINVSGLSETHDRVVAGSLSGAGAEFRIVGSGDGFATAFWDSNRNWSATELFGVNNAIVNLSDIFTTTTSFNPSPLQGSFSFTSTGGGTGNQLTWTAVPEPTSALAGILLAAGLLRRRRTR